MRAKPAASSRHERSASMSVSSSCHRDRAAERRRPRRLGALDSQGDAHSRISASPHIPVEMASHPTPLSIVRDAKEFLQATANARPNTRLTIRRATTTTPTSGCPFEEPDGAPARRLLPDITLRESRRHAESAPPTRGVHNPPLTPARLASPPRTDPPRRRKKNKSRMASNMPDSPIPSPSAARSRFGVCQSSDLAALQHDYEEHDAMHGNSTAPEQPKEKNVAVALASALELAASAASATRSFAGYRNATDDQQTHHPAAASAGYSSAAAVAVETGPWRQIGELDETIEWQPPTGMENLFRPDCDYWDDAEDKAAHLPPSPRLPGERCSQRMRSEGDKPAGTPKLGQRLSAMPNILQTHALLDSTQSSSSSGPKMAPSVRQSIENEPKLEQTSESKQLPPGAVQGSKFSWQRGELLGRGSLGAVHKAMDVRTGQLIAVKEVHLDAQDKVDEKFRKDLQNEVDLYKDIKHPRIVAYLGHDYLDGKLFIYLEYMAGNSLAQVLSQYGPLDETLCCRYTHNLLEGLEYLHTRDPPVLHRDIKGANILVGMDRTVKLSDFGCSKRTSGTAIHTLRGSIPWMAPEVMVQSGYGRKADIWSLGCVVIEMTTAEPPWGSFDNHLAAMVRIAMSEETPPVPSQLSEHCRSFIIACTKRAPHERPDAKDFLMHDFVTGPNRSAIDESWGSSS